mmetsp:Transcript_38213/g.83903  ORF Transcript_38213/g.83903 Transcript_38213/m.83903 type:complete len:431 (-) Transcript_38213:5-1297(-)
MADHARGEGASSSSSNPRSIHTAQSPPLVELTLVDVSADLAASSDIAPLLSKALDVGGGGCIHVSVRPSNNNSADCPEHHDIPDQVRERISKSVTRFIKPEDRYLALGSLLLKSRAYHQTLADVNGEASCSAAGGISLPVVDLPRTEYRKPYIPIPESKKGQDRNNNHNHHHHHHLISVSHQFPYVGLSRLNLQSPYLLQSSSTPLHVGLDIVTYQPPNPRLYSSTSEFLDVFRDSFTSSEWEHVVDQSAPAAAWFGRRHKSDEDSMREFYLRWAVKEAYTKALGVGMGLDFGSFDVRFDCCKNNSGGLVESFDMAKEREDDRNTHRLATLGKIVRCGGNDAATGHREEIWHFTFTELGGKKPSELDVCTSTTSKQHRREGCACVCVGPITPLEVAERNAIIRPVDVRWMGLEDVLYWHKEDRKLTLTKQ